MSDPFDSFNVYWRDSSPKHHAWEAGDVVRLGSYPFADAVILGFNNEGYARAARPYVYASGVGTVGPTALTGVEIVDMLNLARQGSGYTKIASGRKT